MKKLLLFLKKIRAMQNDDRLIHWNRDKKNFRASPAYSELEERLELLESSRSSFSFLSTSVQCHIVCVIIVVRHYFHPFDIYQNQAGSSSPSFASVYHLLYYCHYHQFSRFCIQIIVFLAKKKATTIMNGMMLKTIKCWMITSPVIIKLGW